MDGLDPAGYAGAKDAVVLERTAQLVSHPRRRFLETGQFVLDVMTKGGLHDDGVGAADIRHVRLMHAAVRHMLQHEADVHDHLDGWDPAFGVPLNQEALLATQFTFSVVGLRSLQRFGVNVSDREKEAYIHLWSVIGHMMGVRDDLLPLDFADSSTVWDRITAKEYSRSPGGTLLTKSAIEVMRQLIPVAGSTGSPPPASGSCSATTRRTCSTCRRRTGRVCCSCPVGRWAACGAGSSATHSPEARSRVCSVESGSGSSWSPNDDRRDVPGSRCPRR